MAADSIFLNISSSKAPFIFSDKSHGTFSNCFFQNVHMDGSELFDVSFGGAVTLRHCLFRNLTTAHEGLVDTTYNDYTALDPLNGVHDVYGDADMGDYDIKLEAAAEEDRRVYGADWIAVDETISDCLGGIEMWDAPLEYPLPPGCSAADVHARRAAVTAQAGRGPRRGAIAATPPGDADGRGGGRRGAAGMHAAGAGVHGVVSEGVGADVDSSFSYAEDYLVAVDGHEDYGGAERDAQEQGSARAPVDAPEEAGGNNAEPYGGSQARGEARRGVELSVESPWLVAVAEVRRYRSYRPNGTFLSVRWSRCVEWLPVELPTWISVIHAAAVLHGALMEYPALARRARQQLCMLPMREQPANGVLHGNPSKGRYRHHQRGRCAGAPPPEPHRPHP